MRYEELVEKLREATKGAVVSKTVAHFAFQFNVEGEAEGALYLEISEGKIHIEPYEYYDRDLLIATSAEVLVKMAEGELQPMEAYANGGVRILYGDVKNLRLLPICVKKECLNKKAQEAVKTEATSPKA